MASAIAAAAAHAAQAARDSARAAQGQKAAAAAREAAALSKAAALATPPEPPPPLSDAEEAELDIQAEELAAKSLASLPEAARSAKLPVVKAGILKRLRAQAQAKAVSPAASAMVLVKPRMTTGGAPPAPLTDDVNDFERPPRLSRPPTELPPPQDGIEACGDDPWFADPQIRLALRDAVSVAHAELKILVGNQTDEIARMAPQDGSMLSAGALLKLGGPQLGGYGSGDIAYAYRQLSRACHPDKNPGNPFAATAFKRLGECQAELKRGHQVSNFVLPKLRTTFHGSGPVPEEESVRPQEAIFAESNRLIAAVLALESDGLVADAAHYRAQQCLSSGSGSWARPFSSSPADFLKRWHEVPELIQNLKSPAVRTAFDSAAKRYRCHFLCGLTRLAMLEGRRSGGCVRQIWSDIWALFPEIALWQQLRTMIEKKCRPHGTSQTAEEKSRERSRSPLLCTPAETARKKTRDSENEEKKRWSQWARRWRKMIRAVLPSGAIAAAPWSDPELRKLCAAMWRDFADPLSKVEGEEGEAARRALGMFRTEARGAADIAAQKGAAPAEWAFVPAADLLLVVGEGLVGISLEGAFVDGASVERVPFGSAIFQTMM